ncbi:hypothetical protein DPMN_186209 [Dreissena polymorpha]|uniref:Uncharacterized protein n=1 Tax=Dreissena polymorpha TaxID=45954 RepID=A0A9D4DLX1_DREPO|nr:hypothetical protein DPMN_186209 [Dreissena polymorpha]
MRTGVGCPRVKVTVDMDGVHIPYQRPQIVDAIRLIQNKQDYLYKSVRTYLSDTNKDATCPCPETQL